MMKCMVCGGETGNKSACCDQCKEKIVGRSEPGRAVDRQAALESSGAKNSDIAVAKKRSKKWLLAVIPLLLLVIMIGGIWVVKNIDMDDPNAKFVMGSDGNSIFNLSSDEFMEKILSTGMKEDIVSIGESDQFVLIKTSIGVNMTVFTDEFKPKISAVMLSVNEHVKLKQAIGLDLMLEVAASILDEDFDVDKDGDGLIEEVHHIAAGNKSMALFEANGISYFVTRDNGEICILISPID